MSQLQFGILLVIWLFGLLFITMLTWFEFCRVVFNFNIFFSLIFLVTFFFGFPLTILLIFFFHINLASPETLMQALLSATCFYAIYYITYKTRLGEINHSPQLTFFTINRVETHLTCMILTIIALVSISVFFMHNGFLIFKLHSYRQIFSAEVSWVALKRFFYFFIPAMLMIYFIHQDSKKAWFFFLTSTVAFGLLTYAIIGGTRANIIISFAIFLFVGIIRGWISLWMLLTTGAVGVMVMFWLALKRYGMNVTGSEAFYTFLYLTRDTFSPWENLALLLQNYDKIEFQWLTPIFQDFYIFIPTWLWPDRPDIVLNTANYFTWKVLDNHSGLTISPTLIGSLIVMGGIWFIPPGALAVGLIIKWLDWLYLCGNKDSNRYKSAILHSFCFGAIFNIIVLTREGIDSFISRLVFFIVVFGFCLFLGKLLYWLFDTAGLIHNRKPKITTTLS